MIMFYDYRPFQVTSAELGSVPSQANTHALTSHEISHEITGLQWPL